MNLQSMDSWLNRRAACLALTSLFALPTNLAGGARAAVSVNPRDDPFSLGVASGMPRPDSVVLWTRLAPRPYEPLGGLPEVPISVRWELAENESFSAPLRSGEVKALPEHAHSVHVDVRGLPADRRFFYRFIMGKGAAAAVSPIGRTRTAPAVDAAVGRLRLALASCQHYEHGSYVAHRDMAAQDLDFVLFVGDYIYESSNPRYLLRPHEGPEPTTLAAYRARHATYKLDPDLRASHAAHPWILTWDDHEVVNDYAANRVRGDDGQDPRLFLQRRAAAYKAYFEHMPVSPRMAPRGPNMRIHDRYAWGQLADLWTLDCRQYRSAQACADGRAGGRLVGTCNEMLDASRTVLGREQNQWLQQGLVQSKRSWKLLGQGSQMSEATLPSPLGRRIQSDGWDGYPVARQQLLRTLADAQLRGVLSLGGDVHRHVAANLRAVAGEGKSPVLASEFVCSSISSRSLPDAAMALLRNANPDMVHARSDERGYALVDITPDLASCDFRATPFPARSDATLYSQARFVAHVKEAGVEAA
jgi:alkaline phosphatase D